MAHWPKLVWKKCHWEATIWHGLKTCFKLTHPKFGGYPCDCLDIADQISKLFGATKSLLGPLWIHFWIFLRKIWHTWNYVFGHSLAKSCQINFCSEKTPIVICGNSTFSFAKLFSRQAHHGDIKKVSVQNSKSDLFPWIEHIWYETVTTCVFPYTLCASHTSCLDLIKFRQLSNCNGFWIPFSSIHFPASEK